MEPLNTWKRLDDSTTKLYLNCTIEHGQLGVPISTLWISHLTDSMFGDTIATNDSVLPGYVNDFIIEGTHNLVFLTPSLNESGSYACRNSLPPFVANKKAEVIILGEFYALDKLVATCTFLLVISANYVLMLTELYAFNLLLHRFCRQERRQ